MTFRERAWKERLKTEDKALLEHTISMREAIQRQGTPSITSSVMGSTASGGRVFPSPGRGAPAAGLPPTGDPLKYYSKNHVAGPVGSSMVERGSSLPSVAGSVRSVRSSQISHKGASTVDGGSSKVTGVTVYNERITALERSLEEERKTRESVQNELAEIKQLLLEQRKETQNKRKAAYGRPPLGRK